MCDEYLIVFMYNLANQLNISTDELREKIDIALNLTYGAETAVVRK